jgi:hypothetical protein
MVVKRVWWISLRQVAKRKASAVLLLLMQPTFAQASIYKLVNFWRICTWWTGFPSSRWSVGTAGTAHVFHETRWNGQSVERPEKFWMVYPKLTLRIGMCVPVAPGGKIWPLWMKLAARGELSPPEVKLSPGSKSKTLYSTILSSNQYISRVCSPLGVIKGVNNSH